MEKVLIIEQGGSGGVCHYTFELANAIERNGYQVGLFTSEDYELKTKEYEFKLFNNIKWCRNSYLKKMQLNKIINVIYYLLSLLSLVKLIIKEKYEVIHIQGLYFLPLNILTVLILKILKVKIIFTPHNTFPRYNNKKQNYFFKLMFKFSNKIVVHSQFDLERLEKFYKVDNRKIVVIPHGNYEMFVNGNHEAFNLDDRNILFFGYIRPDKGLEFLLEGFADFIGQITSNKKYKLYIVGRPEGSFEKYQNIINKRKIENEVKCILEYVPFNEVGNYFFNAHLVVLPYIEISQSGVLQIAMAYGKPILVSNVGGLPEVIIHNENGFVVEPSNSKDIARILLEAFKNEDRLEFMGEKNRLLSQTKYSWNTIGRKTIEVYNEVKKSII